MPLDPNIILANADPSRQYDPVASMQKAQNLKAAMLQGQVQEQALQDAKDFTRINGVTPGMAKHQQELATAQWRTQEAKSAATNEKIKAQDWLAAQQSRTYQTALDALESGAAPPEQIHNWTLGTTAKNAQQLGIDTSKSDDPKHFAVQIPNHPTESDPSVPQMAPEWDREAQKRWLQQQVKATTPEAVAEKRVRLALDQQKADAENWKVEKLDNGFAMVNTKTGEWKKAPEGFNPQRTAAQVNVTTPGAGFDPAQPLTPAEESEAKARAKSGERLTPSSRNPGVALKINARSDYLAEQAGTNLADVRRDRKLQYTTLTDFEGKGQANVTIRALNTMTEHVDTARRMAKALDAGDVPLFTQLSQALSKATGKPAVTNFETLREFLAGEVAKVAAGGHLTEGEIKSAADKLRASQSPAQMNGALDTMDEVAGGKLVALDQDYTRVSKGGKTLGEDNRLTPATLRAFNDVKKRQGEGKTAKPATGTPDIASIGTNTRFPKAAWTKDGPDGPGWYEKHGTNVRKVE